MANFLLHKADSRGISSNGWMYSKHSFCFADFYKPERIHFGALRVINDITIAPGKGLLEQAHSNIEIISLCLKGNLSHKDSLGNRVSLHEGGVAAMSTGSGYVHDETNESNNKSLRFLQLWIFSREKNLKPNYTHKQFDVGEKNKLQLLVSPNKADHVTWIQQDAWIYLSNLDAEKTIKYTLKDKKHGVYVFVTQGGAVVSGNELNEEDGLGIWDAEDIDIQATKNSQILLIEVPMDVY